MDSYQPMGENQTIHDEVVSAEDIKANEKEVNAHGEMWFRFLSAGKSHIARARGIRPKIYRMIGRNPPSPR